jgi:hypothetical protein
MHIPIDNRPHERGRLPGRHPTRLKTGRALDKFPDIVVRLAGTAGRFCTMLDYVDTGFIPDGILDQLPLPSTVGAVRTGAIDLNKPRARAVLAALLALAPAPGGFTVADLAASPSRENAANPATPTALNSLRPIGRQDELDRAQRIGTQGHGQYRPGRRTVPPAAARPAPRRRRPRRSL